MCKCKKLLGKRYPGIEMADDVFEFMVCSETEDVKLEIYSEMVKEEAKGNHNYYVTSKKWNYHIVGGQFTAAPIGPKNVDVSCSCKE